MHVIQPLREFLSIPDESIPKLVLPQWSAGSSFEIYLQSRKPFDFVQKLGDCERVEGAD
jgi:hypothetical protein